MTTNTQVALMAERVLQAAATANFASLSRELGAAETFFHEEEERLELLGAIAREMRTALADSPSAQTALADTLTPHLHLLKHLSSPNRFNRATH